MGAAVVHFEVNVKDLQRAKDFYTNLFDWNIQDIPSMNYGMIDTKLKMGINGGIGQVEGDQSPFATFYIQVEDPQAYLDKAVSLGATVVKPVTEVPDMVTFALFTDPTGCLVGLVKGPQSVPVEKPKRKPKKVAKKKKRAAKGGRKKRGGRRK
ncbi:MAG: VOC family protein [Ignavibacteria bacterium]|nr:VOC family protein [Ignavibacteria bacterium]